MDTVKKTTGKHYNLINDCCTIIKTPCDNPQGCIGCYHQEMEDSRAFYANDGPLPATAHQRRIKKLANR